MPQPNVTGSPASPRLLTTGVVLAGGLARRIGGGDKALRCVGGVPILQRLVASLSQQCDSLLLNANGDPGRFGNFGLPIVADDIGGNPGPLAGIIAALDRIARTSPSCRWALTISGDTPFPPDDLVDRLHAGRAAAAADIALAASAGRVHPVVALWPVALRHDMRAALVESGERRVRAFAERYKIAIVEWPSEPWDPFLNVNTPEDLAVAETVARLATAAVDATASGSSRRSDSGS